MSLTFKEITNDFGVLASRESKITTALELIINDLPFGNTISEKYKLALKKVVETIMFYNNESKIAVVPLETGLGKTLTMINTCAFMVNDEKLRPYSGTIILHLLQKDCDRTTHDINKKAGKEVAYSYHSGKEKGKKRNNIDVRELEKYPIIVTTHEGYKRFVEPDSIKPINKILSWTDKQINANKSNWNRYYRRRLIVDEEISNVKIYNITLDSLKYLRNIGLSLGNSLLMDKLNDLIYNIEKLFLRPYDVSADKLRFISLDLEVPKDIEKAIYDYGNYKTRDIFLGIVNFLEHGGIIKYTQKEESKYISTYQYIDINHPLFYTIQLDATARINYLYKLNDDFEIIDLPKLKTYKNTYIHIYKKTTGSKTNLKKQFENGLLTASIDSIVSKIEDNSKVLIIFNDSDLEKLFKHELLKRGNFPNIFFTHFGEITGENTWRDCEKVFVLGTPIYRESNYPILYHCTSKDFDLNKFDMLMLPNKGAKRYKEIEFEKVRVSLIARDLVQGINRVRCRLWKNGDTHETHVYLINKDEEVNKLIKEAMPMVNIAYDWDIAHNNITQNEYEKSLPAEERLLIYLKKILHDADYREELIQKGVITKKGISKQGLRMTVTSMGSRATFNKAIMSLLGLFDRSLLKFCVRRFCSLTLSGYCSEQGI